MATKTIAVKFGGFSSATGKTCRLGVTAARNQMTPTQAAELLVDTRLRVKMAIDPGAAEDIPGQSRFIDPDERLESVVDSKGVSMKGGFAFGLTFACTEIDESELLQFIGREGTLQIERIGSLHDDGDKPKKGRGKTGKAGEDPDQLTMGDDEALGSPVPARVRRGAAATAPAADAAEEPATQATTKKKRGTTKKKRGTTGGRRKTRDT